MSAQKSRSTKTSFSETPVSRKSGKVQNKKNLDKTSTPSTGVTSRSNYSTPASTGKLVPGKFSVSGNQNKKSTTAVLSPLSCTETPKTPGSATQVQLTRENKNLKEENEALKAELEYIKSIYKQLVEESHIEQFDDRRVNLLKSQVIQLERQVLLQSAALNARSTMLLELENNLSQFRDVLREKISTVESGMPHVALSCEFISNLAGMAESTRCRLYKKIEDTGLDEIVLPLVYMGKFVKSSAIEEKSVTLLDICSGKYEHLNLKHVCKLESKLCQVFKELSLLEQTLCSDPSKLLNNPHLAQPIRDRLQSQVQRTVKMLSESCQDLLSLSVLVPSAPWPPLRRPALGEMTVENTLSTMPALGRGKQKEVEDVLRSLFKAFNYQKHMLNLEVKILKEELVFHQSVYELQVDYTESLLAAVREAYGIFEKKSVETLYKPLEVILSSYEKLKTTASEDSLKEFLTVFKENSDELSSILESFQQHKNNQESPTSEFGQHFYDSLNALVRDCVKKRDKLMKELLQCKDDQRNLEQENTPTQSPETLAL